MVAERYGVYLVALDPTVGSEISKTRPCVVVSPDEMNRHLRTAIITPMTTRQIRYATRVRCFFAGRRGEVALDQLRAIDQSRLAKHLGKIGARTAAEISRILQEMFA